MPRSRKHFNTKNIFLSGLVVCLLTLFSINQKADTKAQTIETKRNKPELYIETGHLGAVNSLTVSPDGKILASGSADKTVKLFSLQNKTELKSFEHKYGDCLAFSPNGKLLAIGGDQGINLWEVETGKLISSFEESASSIDFSPDGKVLASTFRGQKITLWDIERSQEIKSLSDLKAEAFIFLKDNKSLLITDGGGFVRQIEFSSGKEIKSLKIETEPFISAFFSPDGKSLLTYRKDNSMKLWDVSSGQLIQTFTGHISKYEPRIFAKFSKDGKLIASGIYDKTIKIWNVETGQFVNDLKINSWGFNSVEFTKDSSNLVSGDTVGEIKFWDVENGNQTGFIKPRSDFVYSGGFSKKGDILALAYANNNVRLWDFNELKQTFHFMEERSGSLAMQGEVLVSGKGNKIILRNLKTGKKIREFQDYETAEILSIALSPDGKLISRGTYSGEIRLWNLENGQPVKFYVKHHNNESSSTNHIETLDFSPDSKILASGIVSRTIKLWDIEKSSEIKTLDGHKNTVSQVLFSDDGKTLWSSSYDTTIKQWNVETGEVIRTLECPAAVTGITFSPDGKILASSSWDGTVKLWNVESGQEIKSFKAHIDYFGGMLAFTPDGKFLITGREALKFWDVNTTEHLATLISLNEQDWVITTPDGRFDTNLSLDNIEGLHWIINDEILKPLPLDIFMRQYFEPDLLKRVLRYEQFKPLPSIAEINRVQPRVEIKEIKAKANNADLVDVVVEVENRTEEIAQKRLTSGVFDLRLFRDGQLVGTSAKSADLEEYINSAPQAIEKDRAAKSLLNTEEDKAWRKANDLQKVVKFDKNKATFVFENVRLPHDGRDKIEFSAYAFNDDRVKSDTSRKSFEIKSPTVLTGNTYLVSIGVNASENPNYNLNYAAVDAYKTQEILGERLKANLKGTNSKLIQIQLVSDYDSAGKLREKTATKPIIKSLFNRLAGKTGESADFPVLVDGQKITADKLPAIQPEDTLIITYSGHGYADRNGIFYLLPYDIGANTEKLTTEVLPKMISSDELSLWMRDVTAKEMLMIVDACHSSAAVQGDGFKPGPMASRGLGQLAYDKGMKILSATQANNVALELGGSLKQGLLSYALLQDGIFSKLADTDSNKQLFYREWLKYGEIRVPKLYEGIKNGTIKSVTIDNKPPTETQRSEIYYVDKNRKQTLQEPKLFDFNEKRDDVLLINLP